MILSEFIRVVDMSWEQFGWGMLWGVLVIILFNIMVMMTLIPVIYDWIIKGVIPNWYDCKMGKLQVQIKNLKTQIRESENRTAEYRDRLERISNSADVKGE